MCVVMHIVHTPLLKVVHVSCMIGSAACMATVVTLGLHKNDEWCSVKMAKTNAKIGGTLINM